MSCIKGVCDTGFQAMSALSRDPDFPEEGQGHDPRQVPRLGQGSDIHCVCVCGSREKMVSAAFMRKYIHVAKIIKPVLTQESAAYIAEEYSRLRSQDSMSSDTARVSPPAGTVTQRVGTGAPQDEAGEGVPARQEHWNHFSVVIPSLFLSGLKGFLLYCCSSSGSQWVHPALERVSSDNPCHNHRPPTCGCDSGQSM